MYFRTLHIALLAAIITFVAAQGVNPCHRNKEAQGRGVTCEKVRLPKNLCKACKLKPFVDGGKFANCRSIYDLDAPACRTQLKQYAQFNRHCDPVRARLVKNIKKNKQPLDYFMYAVCEECCDCVPMGAGVNQYRYRRRRRKLLNANRGNCAAHAYFDLCKIWPNVRYVTLGGGKEQFWKPKICPLLTQWFNSPDGANWLQRSYVPLDPRVATFLGQFLRVAKCRNRDLWQKCAALEHAQKRL